MNELKLAIECLNLNQADAAFNACLCVNNFLSLHKWSTGVKMSDLDQDILLSAMVDLKGLNEVDQERSKFVNMITLKLKLMDEKLNPAKS